MEYVLICILSYLLGSIPFAFIIVKLFAKKNVLFEGSGNVGAMNSYEITRKKWIGITVFLFDFFKGFLAIQVCKSFFPENDLALFLSAAFVVFGHNYSIFLKFKGGKGLATTSGVLFLIQPILLLVWFIFWLIFFYFVKKDMDYANPFATLLTPFFFFIIPESFIKQSAFIQFQSKIVLFISLGTIALIIVSKYLHLLFSKLSKN